MDELQELRREIDAIDAQLTRLFCRRMEVTRRVGQYKLSKNLPVLDRTREAQVLANKAALAPVGLEEDVTALFEGIMALSRRQQQRLIAQETGREEEEAEKSWLTELNAALACARPPLSRDTARVLYQGEPGAYAEEAAVDFFGENCRRNQVKTWEDVFTALRDGAADYGVLPIENSSTGSINQVYDLLAKYGAYIVGEQTVRVNHCLMAPKGASISGLQEAVSHEQGLLQCEEFLRNHPDWVRTVEKNTAAAAKLVAERGDTRTAAIGSRRAAALYGLEILAENINFNADNFTRFVVVSAIPELREGREKVSALFTLRHESGSLYKILSVFARHGLNLLKLESRPIPGRSWEYRFFLDFSGDLWEAGVTQALLQAAGAAEDFRILGNY